MQVATQPTTPVPRRCRICARRRVARSSTCQAWAAKCHSRALDLALSADNTPLRLQVGGDSIAAVRAHAEHLLRDLATWEDIGSDIRVDASAADEAWHSPLNLATGGAATA